MSQSTTAAPPRDLPARAAARPGLVAVLLAALMAVLLAAVPGVRFEGDVTRAFGTGSELARAQRALEAGPGGALQDVVLLVEGEMTADALGRARDLALDLEFAPGVVAVASPFALRFPPAHPEAEAPVIPSEITAEAVAGRMAAFAALGTGLPTLLAEDALLIVATADPDARPLGATVGEIRDLAAPLEAAGLAVTATGAGVARLEIEGGLGRDMLVLNAAGAALTVLAALILLRDARLAAIAVAPGLLASAAALGLAGWSGLPITALSNVVPMLMLVLGVANGVHLTLFLARAEGSAGARTAEALRTVGPATALTSATTALAFAAILTAEGPQLRQFAALGAAASALSLPVVLAGFAALAARLAPPPRAAAAWADRFAARLGAPGLAAPRRVAAGGLVALVLAGAGFWTTTPWFALADDLPRGSAIGPANDRIAARFGGGFRAWVELPPGTDWTAYRAAVLAVEAAAPPGAVLSELALARWLGDPAAPPDAASLGRLPGAVADRLRDPGTGARRLLVSVPEPMRSEASRAAWDRLEAAAAGAGARVLGLPAILRHETATLVRQLSLGLLVAAGAGALVVAGALRRARLLPAILLANLLPVLAVGAALHLVAGGRLTPPGVLALTIAFGVAVDDTVHLLHRYGRARAAGRAPRAAAHAAIRRAGGAMTVATAILLAGLSATAFSAFEPIRLFGAMLGLSLAAALLVDLAILPALLLVIGDPDEGP